MKTIHLLLFTFLFTPTAFAAPLAPIPINPDPKMTPGAECSPEDKDFAEYRYKDKVAICNRNVKTNQKNRIYDAYHIPSQCHARYTIDHFVPLALGGSNSPLNLWPEHLLVKATRQQMEQDLFNKVQEGLMSAADAVEELTAAKIGLVLDLTEVDGCG